MITYKKYDLHCHSTRSDGTFSPTEVVKKAQQSGVEVLALTDHDTTLGLTEARETAESLGIKFINGVEISCEHILTGGYGKNQATNKIIHVLALDFNNIDKMSQELKKIQESRANRGRAIVSKLVHVLASEPKSKQPIDENELWSAVLAKADGNPQAVGRAHIAKVLYEMGIVTSLQQAFNRYLADNKSAYVKMEVLTMQQTIELIHACGGKAVLAHPTGYNLSATRERKLIVEFAQMGGDASELPAKREPLSKRRMIDKVIADNKLLISVGSDFHGSTMPWRKLGDVPKETSEQVGIWNYFR